uniref:C2H2-type domain-containing protein n=1 Tax=Marseillevirus LCMAC101 TaxID=2506602 RepID=A0A481YTI5_9VIRU|nr:MAG: hypothetical protein LCMAC101_06700 [Marseillevirus LCMAC101]
MRHVKSSVGCPRNKSVAVTAFECESCKKTFTIKTSLDRHLDICSKRQINRIKTKYKNLLSLEKEKNSKLEKENSAIKKQNTSLTEENEELKDELSEQKGVVAGLQKAPGKTYNAYIHPKLINLPVNNIRALTDEYVTERVNDGILTYEKASRGYPGMLEVICELITHENNDGIIERNYVCTDVSRNSFHRLLESKKWKSDKGGKYLNNMLDTFREIIEEYKDKVYETYKKTPHDSFEWEQIDWERKNISRLYSGIVCKEGISDREDLVNILRKEISKRASV